MIKKGVLQITVELKSLKILIAITNLVFIKLLQNVNSKCYFKNVRFYKIFCLILLLKRSLNNSLLGLLLYPDLFNNSIASRQAISFHLIAMINQLMYFVDIVAMEYSVHVYWFSGTVHHKYIF